MKKTSGLLLTLALTLASTSVSAQSAIDCNFESGMPEGWTTVYPEGYEIKPDASTTYGWQAMSYLNSKSKPNITALGVNGLGGTTALASVTGQYGKSNPKNTTADNWFISPEVAIDNSHCYLTFQFGANDQINIHSLTTSDENRMKLEVLVSTGGTATTDFTEAKLKIIPMGVQKYCSYCVDLTGYIGKKVHIAFRDYGTSQAATVRDTKLIDNIKLGALGVSDYAVEEKTPILGQAVYMQPFYTIKVTNYGMSKGKFTAHYSINDLNISQTVNSEIAAGDSVDVFFNQMPYFTAGDSVDFKTWVTGDDDAYAANDTAYTARFLSSPLMDLPYSVCNNLDEESTEGKYIVFTEFNNYPYHSGYSPNAKCYWYYRSSKVYCWLFNQISGDDKYVGMAYLSTTKAFHLPAGKVYFQTIGTATLTDMKYEVYIAQYGAESMADYATKVGESDILPNVIDYPGIHTETVELNIPAEGDYIIAIRPISHLTNAQMTLAGYTVSTTKPTAINEVQGLQNSDCKDGVDAFYNIAGQRVNANAKGLIICDGKKYVRK